MTSVSRMRILLIGCFVVVGLLLASGMALAKIGALTVRIYGQDGVSAGDETVIDPVSGQTPEDFPYTGIAGARSIFDPEGTQAPASGSLTWNPAWMYENETLDENQRLGLYNQLLSDDINIAEEVWFRMWYEPQHRDVSVTLDSVAATSYPAIVEEFTYLLMEAPEYATLSDSWPPQPIASPVGRTQMVFPVGIKDKDWQDPFGYGLRTFDANFDQIPDIVEVDSEKTLAQKIGVDTIDFNSNGRLDDLNEDETLLSGDEMVVLSIAPNLLKSGQKIQFIDHAVEVMSVISGAVTLHIWYTGNLQPVDLGSETLSVGQVMTYKTRLPGIRPGAVGIDQGPFYVHVLSVDREHKLAQIRIGRALGATHANLETGEPSASLKRFYVDGHSYSVVAIGAHGRAGFQFLTLRTPLPALNVPVEVPQHSVRLQNYTSDLKLAVAPPFSHEHYFLKNVQRSHTAQLIGEKIGPVAPVVQGKESGYWGAYSSNQGIAYQDQREIGLKYTAQGSFAPFHGAIDHAYIAAPLGQDWLTHLWDTQPAAYVDMLLPDIQGADDLYLVTSPFSSRHPDQGRVKFWFDPATSDTLYSSPNWTRLYGASDEGSGDPSVISDIVVLSGGVTQSGAYHVEIKPYTDSSAPLNPVHDQAPLNDAMAFNIALLSEFESCVNDLLQAELYSRLAVNSHDALERVFFRMWYEPDHLDPVLAVKKAIALDYAYPALMQEFTYLLTDPQHVPQPAQPGWSTLAFPVGATFKELFDPFGYGLTTFDANFDQRNDDVLVIHSEKSLADMTGIHADFDGDGEMDELDTAIDVTGDELVILTVGQVTLSLDPAHKTSAYAMLLDHMVELVNVTPEGLAQLQLWNTGGGLDPKAEANYQVIPHKVGSVLSYVPGAMGITGRNMISVGQIEPESNNLQQVDGGWFIFVHGANPSSQTVSVSIGRALGATHSALYDGKGRHDLANGSPGYLKHFYVDGHKYEVVAIGTLPCTDAPCAEPVGFKSITVRTPVPMHSFANAYASQLLQGYTKRIGDKQSYINPISVLPPYNFKYHSVTESIFPEIPTEDVWSKGDCHLPLAINMLAEQEEAAFTGELKGVLTQSLANPADPEALTWETIYFATQPDAYACFSVSPDQRYHVTSSWLDQAGERVQFWYEPRVSQDLFINPASAAPIVTASRPSQSLTQTATAADGCQQVHVVQAGENLWTIAQSYQVSIEAIVGANNLQDPRLIYGGQQLLIPTCATSSR